jgi:hypothetical protein
LQSLQKIELPKLNIHDRNRRKRSYIEATHDDRKGGGKRNFNPKRRAFDLCTKSGTT